MIEKYNRTASLICKYLFSFFTTLEWYQATWIKVDKLKQAWEKNLKTIEKLFVPVNAAHQSKEKKKSNPLIIFSINALRITPTIISILEKCKF